MYFILLNQLNDNVSFYFSDMVCLFRKKIGNVKASNVFGNNNNSENESDASNYTNIVIC